MLSFSAARSVASLKAVASSRCSGPLLPYQSRRWKTNYPKAIKRINFEQFDMLEMIAASNTKVHNPLANLDADYLKEIEDKKAEEEQTFAKYVPQIRGSHPLPLEDEYMRKNLDFLRRHKGIKDTSTRKFVGIVEPVNSISPKTSFGILGLFQPFVSSKLEYHQKKHPEYRMYVNEFNFTKSQWGDEQYLIHLGLYVRMLYTLPGEKRYVYFNDFFLIIKAIRQKPKMHKRMVDNVRYKQLIMWYFLTVGQPHMAIAVAVDLLYRALPENIVRWGVVRLLGLPPLYDGDAKVIGEISVHANDDDVRVNSSSREYRYNHLVHNLVNFYTESNEVCLTDMELIRLIRCIESRVLAKDLMDILPLVLKRLYEGRRNEMPANDMVELFYESRTRCLKATSIGLGMRYALAFWRIGYKDKAVKVLATLADMPIGGNLKSGTQQISMNKLAAAMVSLSDITSTDVEKIILTTLEQMAKSEIEPSSSSVDPMSWTEYESMLIGDILSSMQKGEVNRGHKVLNLLVAVSGRLSSTTTKTITDELCRKDIKLVLRLMSQQFYELDSTAQENLLKPVVRRAQNSQDFIIEYIEANAEQHPVATVQLIYILSRRVLTKETTRRQCMITAFKRVMSTRNMDAIGLLIVLAAAPGPDNTQPSSLSSPQYLSARANMVEAFIGELPADMTSQEMALLLPYLFKMAATLKIRDAESLLWKELLNQGIEPNWRALQNGMMLRMDRRYNLNQAVELIESVLRKNISNKEEVEDDIAARNDNGNDQGQPKAALYMAILNGLNYCGLVRPMEALARHMLETKNSSGCQISNRTFGAIASVWLDGMGYDYRSTCEDIQRVWGTLREFVNEHKGSYKLNSNHYNSAIEAYVRKGDVNAAWYLLHVEMRSQGMRPNLKTFHTLISPLAANDSLWPIGKSTVAKFNMHYPDVVREAVRDTTSSLQVKALLHQATNMQQQPPASGK